MSASNDRLLRLRQVLDTMASTAADPVREHAILQKRAKAAAETRLKLREPDVRLVCFRMGRESFSVPLDTVSSVTMIRSMTPLPGTTTFSGILSVRGKHVTALDLATFFGSGSEARHIGDAAKAIILSWKDRQVALLAEELLGIREMFEADLKTLDGGDPIIRRVGPEGLLVIDVGLLFRDARMQGRART